MEHDEIVIHIEWDGPYKLDAIRSLRGPTDYGIYQVYGGHPVYGANRLLYIGLSAAQHFGERIPQETQWLYNRDAGRVEFYVGRLSGSQTPDDETWDRQIRLAERLLIYTHCPPFNTQKGLGKLEQELRFVHVLNWGNHRDLLPEVSGARWASRDDEFPNYHQYSDEEVPRAKQKA